MGKELDGRRGGVALCVGAKGGRAVNERRLVRKALRWVCDRAIRSAERGIDSIGVCMESVFVSSQEGSRGDFRIGTLAARPPKLPLAK
jgi:hypothetical protein